MTNLYINWLIEHGFDVNNLESRAFNGNTPILQAALEGNEIIVNRLIEAGVDLYTVNNDFNGVLFNACYKDSDNLIYRLVKAGADINDINEDGETALMYAVSASKTRCVNALLFLGADKSIENIDGLSAINYAVKQNIYTQLRYA